MKDFLIYLKENILFYKKNIPDEIYEINSDKKLVDLFEKIPIVDKNTIKDKFKDFLAPEFADVNIDEILDCNKDFAKDYEYVIDGKKYWVEYTSGTTGTPMPTIKSVRERMRLGNSVWKMRRKIDNVKPREMFGFMHNIDGQYPFFFPFIDNVEQRKKKELQFLNESRYSWWHIYPARLEGYCEYKQYYENTNRNPKVIECNGAYVSEEEIEKYKEIFNCTITNNYGCREVWNIAYSCKNGELHINDDNVYLEIVDENDKVIKENNKEGEVVVTSKHLKKMPIVRYRIGDYICYKEIKCSCGNDSRVIQLRPQRNMIIGTNKYGNDVFREVLAGVNYMCGEKKYESINVVQDNVDSFIVNIRKCEMDKNLLEMYFIECSNSILDSDKYRYTFTYNEELNCKSVFVVKK